MKVGIPAEVKNHEYRVAITPVGVHELVGHGHEVMIQKGAGLGSSITDDDYISQGARIIDSADDVWGEADMVLKVKEPVAEEYHRLREGLTLFTYLHLAADKPLTEELMAKKVTGIAYETVQLPSGMLPLLYPMSEVAGCLAPQVGAHAMMRAQGGRGVLMGGVGGVANAKVVVLGAKAPKLVTDDMVAAMKPGSVLVDVAIDQGGCFEGSRPTTHADPTFAVHDAVYYCVANMPGAVPNTSTWALTNATLSYAVKLADKGWKGAIAAD